MLYIILLVPLLTGLACAFGLLGKEKVSTVALTVIQAAFCALIVAACVGGQAYGTPVLHFTESLTFCLSLDGIGKVFALVIGFSWLLTIPYAGVYMAHEGGEPRFYSFLLLTEAAMLGASLSADFMTLYLFYELTTLLSFPLVLHDRSRKALLGAGKYLYYSVGGAFLALFGIAVLFGSGVDMRFTPGGSAEGLSSLAMAAVFCIVLGFGAKAGLYPLHNWLPSAHPAAPAPASALLSGVIAKAGVLAIVRLLYYVVRPAALRGTWVQTALIILALITVGMGSYMGCNEDLLKKRLAYSSISNISYVLVGLFLLTEGGVVGALLQLVFHAAAKVGIFLCAGSIIHLTGCTRVSQLRAMGRRMPVTFVAFVLLALSLIGIPPFGGFWSKWYLGIAALDAVPGALGYLVPATLIASALLTAGYLFQPVISAFFPGEDCPGELMTPVREPAAMAVPLLILAAVCGLLGFFPNAILSAIQSIAAVL